MKRIITLIIIGILTLYACDKKQPEQKLAEKKENIINKITENDLNNIRELAIRELIGKKINIIKDGLHCIGFGLPNSEQGLVDPPDKFIERFKNYGIVFIKVSKIKENGKIPKIIRDKNNAMGTLYYVRIKKIVGNSAVEIRAARYHGLDENCGFHGVCKKINGKWILQDSLWWKT